MLKGKQFGVVAEYSTSSGQKKSIICFDSKSDSVVGVLRDALIGGRDFMSSIFVSMSSLWCAVD